MGFWSWADAHPFLTVFVAVFVLGCFHSLAKTLINPTPTGRYIPMGDQPEFDDDEGDDNEDDEEDDPPQVEVSVNVEPVVEKQKAKTWYERILE
jgi:hypothetical protein